MTLNRLAPLFFTTLLTAGAFAQSPITISPATVPIANQSVAYTQAFTASGGATPYTWSIVSGALPTGITLNTSTGIISGTPTVFGDFPFTIRATDAVGLPGSQAITLSVNVAGKMITTNLPANLAIVNISGTQDYSAASGGTNQNTWFQPKSTLGQVIKYTVQPGTYTFRVISPGDAAALFGGLTQTQLNSMWTAWTYNTPWLTAWLAFDSSAITVTTQQQLFSGAEGAPANVPDATTAYADAINGGYYNSIFPLLRDATPQKTYTFNSATTLVFTVPDSGFSDNNGGISVLIAPAAAQPLAVTTSSLPNSGVGLNYPSTQVLASGGSGNYSWTATGLPPGLTLSAVGVLSGTPTFKGTFNPVFTVTDPISGAFFTQTTPFTITIAPPSPALSITTTTFPPGEVGVNYSQPIAVTGGYGAYSFSISSGVLSINPTTGVVFSNNLSGVNQQFTVTVTDTAGDSVSQNYGISIFQPIDFTGGTIFTATANESYGYQINAFAGTGVFTWSVAPNSVLPPGLTLSSTGYLSGIPTTAGNPSFNIKVTDSLTGTATAAITLPIITPVSYVATNFNGGTVAVSPDGSTVTTIAGTANGTDATTDASGNIIVAAGTVLNRITATGSVTTIATAPAQSAWVSVAVDAAGNFIVGDNKQHSLWRISPDGVQATQVATYTVPNGSVAEDIHVLVDIHGNYILAEDNWLQTPGVTLFSITPAGVKTQITLSGATLPISVNGLAFDKNGNYMLLDGQNRADLFQVTPQGVATVFGTGISQEGLARNPVTGEYITGSNQSLLKLSADGSQVTIFARSQTSLANPRGVIAIPTDFPSAVEATNPLGYFRLEAPTGTSDVNGYTFAVTPNAGLIESNAAPLGIQANNGFFLDGTTAAVTTGLSGNINTAGSLMAWVNLAVLPSQSGKTFNYIAGESQNGNDFDLQFDDTDTLRFYTTNNGASIGYTPNSLTLVGRWHLVVATFDATAGTRAIYWDGALVAQDAVASLTNKTGAFQIGSSSVFPGRNFKGAIDEVAVWNYALNASQVYRMFATRGVQNLGTISSISPAATSAGSQVTLTITGVNLTTTSGVRVTSPDGLTTTILAPSSVTATQVVVTIPSGLFSAAGAAQVTVVNTIGVPFNQLPLTITAPLSIGPASLPDGFVNQFYSQILTASGGSGSYSWTITGEDSQLNLSLSAPVGNAVTETLSGTPTAQFVDGTLLTVQLTDTVTSQTVSKTYNFFINAAAPPPTTQPSGTTAFVLNENGALISVTGGAATQLVSGTSGCDACFDMAQDASGNFIIAAGDIIRMFSPAGVPLPASPIAALGNSYYTSVAVDAAGNYIVADSGVHQVLRIAPDGRTAPTVVYQYPAPNTNQREDAYVRVDAIGNYILAEDNNISALALSMFRITPAGVATPITLSPSQVQGRIPTSVGGMTFDAQGNYIIVEWNNSTIFTVAPGGSGSNLTGTATILFNGIDQFSHAKGISRDPISGYYLIVDDITNRLSTFSPTGTNFSTVLSGGLISAPGSVVVVNAVPTGTYILENTSNIVPLGNGTTVQCSLCTSGAYDFASDAAGNFIVAAVTQLVKITPAGVNSTIANAPRGSVFLSVAVDASGNYIVGDNSQHRLVKVTPGGAVTAIASYPAPNPNNAEDVVVRIDGAGNYIVAEDNASVVNFHRITIAGSVTNIAMTGTIAPRVAGLALDASGNYVITDYQTKVIDTVTPTGQASVLFSNPNGTLQFPYGIFRDPASGNFLVVDQTNSVLYVLNAAGTQLTPVGTQLTEARSVLVIGAASPLSITTSLLPAGTLGQFYSSSLTATGGSGSFTWTATGLPPGLTLSSAGVLSGTPAEGSLGQWNVQVTVTDANNTNLTSTRALSLAIGAAVPPPPPPVTVPTLTISSSASSVSIAAGGNIAVSVTAGGGVAPYTFSAAGQPAGVSLASGTLSGSPSQAGNFNVSVTVRDSQGATASTSITINVLGITTTSLPAGIAGQFYSATIGATGGSGGITFSATGVPAGLSLSAAGVLSGIEKTSGSYTLSVTASSGGVTTSGSLAVTFAKPQPLSIQSSLPAGGNVNVRYSQSFGATGGFPPYTWSVISGSLPPGLSLSAAGVVSGIPTTAGQSSLTVQVQDTAGATASVSASITIAPEPLVITTQSLPSGMVNVDYPQQALGVSGGVSPYTWTLGSGSLPAGVTLSSTGTLSGVPTLSGSFSPGITVTDQAGAKASASLGLTVRPLSADLVLTTSSLAFSVITPASNPPAAQTVGVQATVASQKISYSVAVQPAAPWLSVTSGTITPDALQVSITPAALTLSAGDYLTTITVTCTSLTCSGHSQSVSVALNVALAPPKLLIGDTLLSFATTTANTADISQSINVRNAGGGTLSFGSMTCEAAWCLVGTPPNLTGGASAAVRVTVSPGLLKPGFYRTQVDITSSGGNGSVPVTLFIAPNSTMTLAPAGGQFNMPAGSAPGNSTGSFLVSVNNPTPVNWHASVVPGPTWLVLGTSSGTSSNTQPGTISFSIDPAAAGGLEPGAYYGLIQVTSTDVANSPQDFEVVLNVTPAASPITPDPQPGGLLFITTVGGVPPPQTVNVYSGSRAPLTFQASATVNDGTGWLSVSPGVGSSSAGSPGVTTVTVSTAGLKAGVYHGGVSYSLSATAVRTVNVTVIVASPGSASAPSSLTGLRESSLQPRDLSCKPGALAPAQTGLVNNFSAPAAWPTPLAILLSNDCGGTVNNGQIIATFSNGDPPLVLSLADPSKALYSGTWSPRKAASQVSINIRASAPGFADVTTQLAGAVVPNPAPLLTPHGTLHSFDPLVGASLAPGTIVQIYGEHLASLTTQPTSIPLPTVSNGTSVIIGGLQAPLYYVSAGQINAQIPFELSPGQQYQIIVSANGALTTPDTIQLSAATPGLAAFADGTLIAQHSDGSLVSDASPAKAGEYLVAYLAGMGSTNATPASGAASPSSPLAQPTDAPTLTINSAPYPLLFTGLTPGLVGLYQMNFQVPAGLPAGKITLAITQDGLSSNQVTMPYQP